MQVIVSDSSAIIDLQKGDLLEVFLELPFEFVIADVLLESELLSLTKKERRFLRENMSAIALDGRGVERAVEIQASCLALSFNDAFSLVVAETHKGAILLTGDGRMRGKAKESGILCHGVLWIVEELAAAKLVKKRVLVDVLELWLADPLVWLPEAEIFKLCGKLRK